MLIRNVRRTSSTCSCLMVAKSVVVIRTVALRSVCKPGTCRKADVSEAYSIAAVTTRSVYLGHCVSKDRQERGGQSYGCAMCIAYTCLPNAPGEMVNRTDELRTS